MRSVLVVLILCGSIALLGTSLFSLVKPLPKLGLHTRQRAVVGLIGALALFVLSLLLAPDAPANKAVPNSTHTETSAQAVPEGKFDGYSPAGSALEAKAAGFRECSSNYYEATCWNRGAKLLGIPAPAVVRMKLDNGKMPSDLSQLRYDEIEFALPLVGRQYPCTADTEQDPYACDEKGLTLDLQRKLVAAGWQMHEWRGTRSFYHPASTVVVVVMDTHIPGQENGVELQASDADSVRSVLKKISDAREKKQQQKASASEFERKMAQP